MIGMEDFKIWHVKDNNNIEKCYNDSLYGLETSNVITFN